jgi:hypothetical protein
MLDAPTATQYAAVTHDKPCGSANATPAIDGIARHVLPFHSSPNAKPPVFVLASVLPRAMQRVADTHATASRSESGRGAGGRAIHRQVLPFQIPASGFKAGLLGSDFWPTAMHIDVVGHDTPVRNGSSGTEPAAPARRRPQPHRLRAPAPMPAL